MVSYCEEIAFYKGENWEKERISENFKVFYYLNSALNYLKKKIHKEFN